MSFFNHWSATLPLLFNLMDATAPAKSELSPWRKVGRLRSGPHRD
jgi:hypothetical protein